jgi:hypothetical protein
MDRNSQFSPNLLDQYTKNKQPGWPNYAQMGAATGLSLGSGSLTPPPANSLGMFPATRYSAPGDRFLPGGPRPPNGMSGLFGAAGLFGTAAPAMPGAGPAISGKTRHNSIDKQVNRSKLLEDFR